MVQGFVPCTASRSLLHSHDPSTRACVVPVEDLLDINSGRYNSLGRILQARGPVTVSWRHTMPWSTQLAALSVLRYLEARR